MPTLEITMTVGCPIRCTFCPQDKLVANYTSDVRVLSFDDFVTIIKKVPRHVRIDFSGMSEPWTNRRATDMLEYVLVDRRNVSVFTTLQGMRDYDRVISLLTKYQDQVEDIVIHLPDAMGNMRGFRNSETYDAALGAFRNRLGSRINFMEMNTPWTPLTRAGNLDHSAIGDQLVEEQPSHHTPLTCTYTPFYDQNVLLPNGDVVLCCMDYSSEHKLGNLLTDDYYSLFHSVGNIVSKNMQYADEGTICRKCSRARVHELDEAKQFWTWSC